MTDTSHKLTEPTRADRCCEPDCGPDTCGSAVVAFAHPQRTETGADTNTARCCEPDCGPDTCG